MKKGGKRRGFGVSCLTCDDPARASNNITAPLLRSIQTTTPPRRNTPAICLFARLDCGVLCTRHTRWDTGHARHPRGGTRHTCWDTGHARHPRGDTRHTRWYTGHTRHPRGDTRWDTRGDATWGTRWDALEGEIRADSGLRGWAGWRRRGGTRATQTCARGGFGTGGINIIWGWGHHTTNFPWKICINTS